MRGGGLRDFSRFPCRCPGRYRHRPKPRSGVPARRAGAPWPPPPSRFCAPGLGSGRNLRSVPAQGRGAATPGAVLQGLLPPPPPPASAGDVYLALCSLLFSLSLFFSLGVGTPWVQGARGNPGWLALCSRSPSPGKGAGWQRLSGCAACRPQPCSPDSMEVEFCFSALGGEVVVVEKAMEFSPKAYASGLSQLRADPPVSRHRLRVAPPRPLTGNTRPRLQFSVALRTEVFPLLTLYSSRALRSPSSAPRGAQLARPRAGPARLLRALGLSVLQAAERREAAPGAGLSSSLTLQLTRGERGTCVSGRPCQAAGFREDAVWQHGALFCTSPSSEFKKGTAAPGCFPAPSQTPCQSAQRCVGPCASVATFVCKNPVTLPFFDEDPCPPRERNLQKWLLLGNQAWVCILSSNPGQVTHLFKKQYWKLGRDAGDFNCSKIFIQGGFKWKSCWCFPMLLRLHFANVYNSF